MSRKARKTQANRSGSRSLAQERRLGAVALNGHPLFYRSERVVVVPMVVLDEPEQIPAKLRRRDDAKRNTTRNALAMFVLLVCAVPLRAEEPASGTGTLIIGADGPATKPAVVKVEVDMNHWGPGAVKELLGWALTFAIPTALGLWALYRSGQNRMAISNTANAAKDAATTPSGTPMSNTSAETIRVLDNVGKGGTGNGQ